MTLDETLFDRYALGAVLGRGTTATVYRAHDLVLDRPIALKAIHLEMGRSAVLAEARAAARISHPNVVIIHDVLDQEGDSYIAMELLEGPTLAQLLGERLPSADEAFRILCDIAAALGAAHAKDVVHCDIKPDNIFVARGERIVVTDFGLANPEVGGGTPGYMAPEQYTDVSPLPSMDVFAWGCVAVEVISGVPPFGTDHEGAQYRTTFDQPYCDLGAVDEFGGLRDVILQSLEKDPHARPRDGATLLAALAAVARSTPATTIPTSRSIPPAPADTPFPPTALSAGTAMAMRLSVYQPGREPWLFDLRAGEEIEVGREATLAIDDPQASRRHAAFWFDGAQVLVTDLGSMNGTVVNGRAIGEFLASPGDVVIIGSTTFHIDFAP